MDPLGLASLGAVGVFSVATIVRPGGRIGLTTLLAAWWAAWAVLVLRFLQLDLRVDAVANYSRAELGPALRIAGAWAGPQGSLLLWWTLAATAATWRATRPQERSASSQTRFVRALAGLQCAGVLSIVLWANPFTTSPLSPANGRGLSPVLEHPAMLVHPPLLYSAQAAVIAAALSAANPASRRSINGAAALLLAATLLGAWWAHDELGWGGWWAWDPVENTALAPLIGLIAAGHANSQRSRRRWLGITLVAMLAGVAAARSGLASSVHAFAPSPGPSLLFAALALLALITLVVRGTGVPELASHHTSVRSHRAAASITALAAGWTMLVVATGEIASMWLGTRTPAGTVDGALLGRLVLPAGLLLAAGVLVFGLVRNPNGGSILAHLGLLVFVAGVAASIADWSQGAVVPVDSRTDIHGETVTVGRPVVTDERPDLARVEVEVTVGGRQLHPALLRYPDLDRTRSRPDRISDWRGETEVAVTYLDDERARIEVRRHAGLGQVWGGGLVMIAGLLVACRRRGGDDHSSRRRRFAASSESSEELGSSSGGETAPVEPATG